MKFLTDWIDKNKANTTKVKGKNPPQQLDLYMLSPIEVLIFWA